MPPAVFPPTSTESGMIPFGVSFPGSVSCCGQPTVPRRGTRRGGGEEEEGGREGLSRGGLQMGTNAAREREESQDQPHPPIIHFSRTTKGTFSASKAMLRCTMPGEAMMMPPARPPTPQLDILFGRLHTGGPRNAHSECPPQPATPLSFFFFLFFLFLEPGLPGSLSLSFPLFSPSFVTFLLLTVLVSCIVFACGSRTMTLFVCDTRKQADAFQVSVGR